MSNVAGKAYAMNVVSPLKPWLSWVNRVIYMLGRGQPNQLRGLLGLSFIHFARWSIVKRSNWPDIGQEPKVKVKNDYLLFCSNFNGTWDQYIDAFSDGLPNGLDLYWFGSPRWPHSIPVTPFKNYIRANQIDTDYYYNSVPGAAQKDVKAALRVRRTILDLEKKHATSTPEEFQKLYISAMIDSQNDLGSQGFAPVASNDTRNASHNREYFLSLQSHIKDAAR